MRYNGLQKYKTFNSDKKFIDKNKKIYTGDKIAFVIIDDGSLACVYFEGYVPIKMYNNDNCIDHWKALDIKLI